MAQKIYEKVLDFHASWIVVNSMQGCPMNCLYCFLKPLGLNKTKPDELCSPQKAIDELLKSEIYNRDFPICLLTSTDPFANEFVIKHLSGLLDEIKKRNIPNTICFVTKKKIPLNMIKKISHNKNIIVYLSYSGLNNSIEKGVCHTDILENFQNLYKAGIPCIHYWRPLLPQNSDLKTLERVMREISPYSKASVIAGLKLFDGMLKDINFWVDAVEEYKKNSNIECFWPKNVLQYIKKVSKKYNHPVYPNNLCAIAHVQSKGTGMGFYNLNCSKNGYCPPEQKILCKKNLLYFDQNIPSILASLNVTCEYIYIKKCHKLVLKSKRPLPNHIVSRIRKITNCTVETEKSSDLKFSSSLINSPGVEI